MHWKFISTTAFIAVILTLGFGAYSLWGAVGTELSAVSWFTVLSSQRNVAYVAGLSLPISALASGLLVPRASDVRPFSAIAMALVLAAATFVLMAFVAPFAEALIMRTALPAQSLTYEAQGWRHWWGVYDSGADAIGRTLNISNTDARPFWRAAGLFAWQPIYVSATALFTTLLGMTAAGTDVSTEGYQRRMWLTLTTLVVVLVFAGWKVARVLSLRFDVPPESSLALMLLGPALLLCGLLIRDLSRGRAGAR
jgi:hypothetical protein